MMTMMMTMLLYIDNYNFNYSNKIRVKKLREEPPLPLFHKQRCRPPLLSGAKDLFSISPLSPPNGGKTMNKATTLIHMTNAGLEPTTFSFVD